MDLAPQPPEHPEAHQLFGQAERHDDQPNQHVGHGQGSDEPVLDAEGQKFKES